MKQALVIIDVQQGMFSMPEMLPFEGEAVVARIHSLLNVARGVGVPVIFIQHDGGDGHPLSSDSAGFAYHSSLMPLSEETVIIKCHCNAFQDTRLAEHLRSEKIDDLTVCGMQTQYCVDTFVRAAVDRSFQVRLVSDAHTTFGTTILSADSIIAHHNDVLNGSFASLELASKVQFVVG